MAGASSTWPCSASSLLVLGPQPLPALDERALTQPARSVFAGTRPLLLRRGAKRPA